MARLRDQVADTIRDRSLWQPDDRVAVAVSGGLDSMVLLAVLVRTAGRHRARLSVVTVDHGTRPDSAADADFVQAQATELGLACHRAEARLGEGASEAACRELRLGVFAGLDVDRVALAHHRDDQAETVVINLLRGSGGKGLAGMAWRRGRLVRPLLEIPRETLQTYAREHGLLWREDPTNADPRFLRNRVRGQVIPLLTSLREGAAQTIARTATVSAAESAFLDAEARRRLPRGPRGWLRQELTEAPPVLVRRALLLYLPSATASQIDAVVAAIHRGRGVVHLSASSSVHIDGVSVSVVVEP